MTVGKAILLVVFLASIASTSAAFVSQWGAWSDCTESCNGRQERSLTCTDSNGQRCSDQKQARGCNTAECTLPFEIKVTCMVLGGLVVVALIVLIILIIKRKNAQRQSRSTAQGFSPTVIESLYDESLNNNGDPRQRKRSFHHFPSSSSLLGFQATPSFPGKEGEPATQLKKGKSLHSISEHHEVVEAIQEAKMHFDVETEPSEVQKDNARRPSGKLTMMTTVAGTQTNEKKEVDKNDSEHAITYASLDFL